MNEAYLSVVPIPWGPGFIDEFTGDHEDEVEADELLLLVRRVHQFGEEFPFDSAAIFGVRDSVIQGYPSMARIEKGDIVPELFEASREVGIVAAVFAE